MIRTTLLAAALPTAVVLLAGATRAATGTRSGGPPPLSTRACKVPVAAAEPGKLPVVQGSEDFSCIDEVASKFQTPSQTITQAFVPADPGCSTDVAGHPNSTEISVTAFNNSGNMDFDGDFKRKDAVVVAKVVNNTNCATRGIRLAPHHTYYWVVEHRGRDSRLVSANDEIKLGRFTSCKTEGFADAAPRRREHIAMIKAKNADPRQGQCDHKHAPGRTHFAAPSGDAGPSLFHPVHDVRPLQRGEAWVLWMACAADCCYADI